MLLAGAALLTPGGLLEPGWLRVEEGRIAALGEGAVPPEPGETTRPLPGRLLLPGFVDLHVHGGGGATYTEGDPTEVARAAAFHRANGTTRTLASLVTAPPDQLLSAVASLAELTEEGLLEGIHLEGPFLSPARCGAQDPRFLLAPDRELLAHLLAAGRGMVRMVTVAPELEGATELIHQIVDAGAIAAIGHSDATYALAEAAIDAGARVATHLCNGMRPLHHREPGIVGAALQHEEVVCELIADGTHLHPALLRLAFRAAPHRVALVTDAIAAAGIGDGRYRLGPARVVVEEGRATLEGGSTIAGSTLTAAGALRHAARDAGLDLLAVSEAASATPARVLGIAGEVGTLEAGKYADLVVLDPQLHLEAVVLGGRWQDVAGEEPA